MYIFPVAVAFTGYTAYSPYPEIRDSLYAGLDIDESLSVLTGMLGVSADVFYISLQYISALYRIVLLIKL